MANLYANQRSDVEEQAEQLASFLRLGSTASLRSLNVGTELANISLDLLAEAGRALSAGFDEVYGGFGGAPKFPNTMSLEFLIRLHLHRQRGEIAGKASPPELDIIEA